MENSKLDTSKIVKYLKQVEDAKNEAIAIAYDLEEQKTTSKKLVSVYQEIMGSSKGNSCDMIIRDLIRIEDIQNELKLKTTYWKEKRKEVKKFIETLDIPSKEKIILSLKYLCNKKSYEIGEVLGISDKQVNRLHNMILEKLVKNKIHIPKCSKCPKCL